MLMLIWCAASLKPTFEVVLEAFHRAGHIISATFWSPPSVRFDSPTSASQQPLRMKLLQV